MASTNKTENIGLSQFLAADKPAWLTDYNNDMMKIDEATMLKSAYDPQGKGGDIFDYADKIFKDYGFYVSPIGNDANEGTQDAPLRTIGEAFKRTPAICNSLRIVLAEGTYNETISLSTRVFIGSLTIVGGADLVSAKKHIVKSIHLNDIRGAVYITGITANNNGGAAGSTGFLLLNVFSAILRYCIAASPISGGSTGIGVQFNTNALALECQMENKSCAIGAYNNSKIMVRGLTGKSNDCAFSADAGGEIRLNSGNTVTATTLYYKANGGTVVKADGTLA